MFMTSVFLRVNKRSRMALFLTILPLEVRQMVYAECFVVGKVFPYTVSETIIEHDFDDGDSDDEDTVDTMLECSGCAAPDLAILFVCKGIHEEAEPMLYQRNTFVLPASDLTARFFRRSLHNGVRRSWIGSVELILDASDMTRRDRELVLDQQLELARKSSLYQDEVLEWFREGRLFPEKVNPRSDDDDDMLGEDLHDAYKTQLAKFVWPRKASYVLDHLTLQTLLIDVRNSKCILDYCTMRHKAVKALGNGFAKKMPESVRVLCDKTSKKSMEQLKEEQNLIALTDKMLWQRYEHDERRRSITVKRVERDHAVELPDGNWVRPMITR